MKNYNDFIKEDLSHIGDGYSSIAYTGSKYDVLKHSKNDVYHDLEFQVHEMMKSKPDLFCRIIKNSKEKVLMEKLDTKRFYKDYYDIELNYYSKTNFSSNGHDYKKLKKWISSEENTQEYINLTTFEKQLMELKLKIFEYFKDFINEYDDGGYGAVVWCDLNPTNFGYIKGTKEIRCFDPIAIDLEELKGTNA